jgi:HEAT repeat protein
VSKLIVKALRRIEAASPLRSSIFALIYAISALGLQGATPQSFDVVLDDMTNYVSQIRRPLPPTNLRIFPTNPDIPAFLGQLRDPDPEVRKSGATALKSINEVGISLIGFIPELDAALTNRDVVVRRYVAAILQQLGEKSYAAASALVEGLSDQDAAVRANAASALGSIGPSAAFAVPALVRSLSDSEFVVRADAARALGRIRQQASLAVPELVKRLQDEETMVNIAAIQALSEYGAESRLAISELVTSLQNADTPPYKRLIICEALADIALAVQDQDVVDALPQLKQAQLAIASIQGDYSRSSSLTVERAVKYLELLPQDTDKDDLRRQKLPFAAPVPSELIGVNSLSLNGNKIVVSGLVGDTNLYYLGSQNFLQEGLNVIATARKRFLFWSEEKKLKQFASPYSRSYAIIVAIDDYDRKNDPVRHDPSGYPHLSFMVEHAKTLATELQGLGFPKENILQFYNRAATSASINETLERFWQGGDLSQADRLFFYFGGHGDASGQAAYLVTYDFDKRRPTLSSLLMRDITGRHFENVLAHHFLVAIDSCHSGLALPQFLSSELDENRLKAFRSLSIIQSETEQPARNIIVSGTGDQKALWENGGIFTQALIAGLGGKADLNQDGIIQFEELALYIKNEVRAKARQTGVVQEPNQWRADHLGRGNVLFIRDSAQLGD